jgi:hypothetical protein
MSRNTFSVAVGENSGNFICTTTSGNVYYFGFAWGIPAAIIERPNGASFLHESEVASAAASLRSHETLYTIHIPKG